MDIRNCGIIAAGGFLAVGGILECGARQRNLGKCHIALGAFIMVIGAYSLMNQQNYDFTPSYHPGPCNSFSLDQIQKVCETALSKGWNGIPSMDVAKHIASITSDTFPDLARCTVELTKEGHALLDQARVTFSPTTLSFFRLIGDDCGVSGLIKH